MKLNLGSHNKRIKGFLNVDILDLPNVDVRHDLTIFPYPWEDESVEEILMVEFLEHISWRKTVGVLKECYRILKKGGVLNVQVPDCESMMYAYFGGGICEGVPHKPQKEEEVLKHFCDNCEGKGYVNPMRWKMAFCGAQKHKFDSHLNIFTPKSLIEDLSKAGFEDIKLLKDRLNWKIKIKAKK